ncbi:MAG: hypothetical protein PHI50_05715, partial [Alphaproteobacteria bacterium]|nr:hypothetical protein [Alphaproteobacteria bacterium]
PKVDEKALIQDEITFVVQVNGKLRGRLLVPYDIEKDEAIKQALELDTVKKFTDGKQIVKTVLIPKKLINVVVK